MIINREFHAGTLESSDVMVYVSPGRGQRMITVQSKVIQQFGKQIYTCINSVLDEYQINDINLEVVDQGALDCTIAARVEAAVIGAAQEG